jgi:hypothetical protein
MVLYTTALEIIVAPVERLADGGHLFEGPGEGILKWPIFPRLGAAEFL